MANGLVDTEFIPVESEYSAMSTWRTDTDDVLEAFPLVVESCYWPLFEVEYGESRLNYRPRTKLSVKTWPESEGRFGHLFEPGNEHVIEELQAEVDRRWERLLELSGEQPNS